MSHNQTLAELQAACERLAEARAEIARLEADLDQCHTSIDSMDEQIDKLRAELALARKVLKAHQWCQVDDDDTSCCHCGTLWSMPHEPDCEWRRAMGEAK